MLVCFACLFACVLFLLLKSDQFYVLLTQSPINCLINLRKHMNTSWLTLLSYLGNGAQ